MNPNTETVKSAVVFGATGLVGKELVKVLLENRDFEFVTLVVRKQLAFTDTRLKQIKLPDFSKLMDLRDKLKAGIFFCCIGTTIKTAGSKDEFAKVDLEIPKSVARLAESLSVPSLVVVSSIGADTGSSNVIKIRSPE